MWLRTPRGELVNADHLLTIVPLDNKVIMSYADGTISEMTFDSEADANTVMENILFCVKNNLRVYCI